MCVQCKQERNIIAALVQGWWLEGDQPMHVYVRIGTTTTTVHTRSTSAGIVQEWEERDQQTHVCTGTTSTTTTTIHTRSTSAELV